MAVTMVEVCAYVGTGNVLKVQQLLHICSEHYETGSEKEETRSSDKNAKGDKPTKEKEEKDKDLSARQAVAVLGIALISMGEDIGGEMAYRTFGHLVTQISTYLIQFILIDLLVLVTLL